MKKLMLLISMVMLSSCANGYYERQSYSGVMQGDPNGMQKRIQRVDAWAREKYPQDYVTKQTSSRPNVGIIIISAPSN